MCRKSSMSNAMIRMLSAAVSVGVMLPSFLVVILVCGLALPIESEGRDASRDDGVDWELVTTTDPDTWSDELVEQIEAAGRDPEKIAERIRLSQQKTESDETKHADRRREFERQVIEEAMDTPVDEWSDGLKARIKRLGWDLDEFSAGVQKRQVIRDALVVPVDGWSDELKKRIVYAGLDLDEITEFVRERQEGSGVQAFTVDRDDINTAIEDRTWGQIKLESSGR